MATLNLFTLVFNIRGAALLVEAAEMGNPDAQYDLGCRLRAEVRFPDKLKNTIDTSLMFHKLIPMTDWTLFS